MPRIPLVSPDKASDKVKAVYDEFYQRMSFPAPPNFIKTQGHSATVARGTWELVKNVLVTGLIPRWQKEMMFVAISLDRNCRYCSAAHIACCRMLGMNPTLLESLVKNVNEIPDLKLRHMIQFAMKCARDPQNLKDKDFETLHTHGLYHPEIMEIIAMSALGSMPIFWRMQRAWSVIRCLNRCDC